MKKTISYFIIIPAVAITTFLLITSYVKVGMGNPITVYTNEKFIRGLYTKVDIHDPKELFRYVFNRLDDEVTIFPTENYYYFMFTANGKPFKGSICLFTYTRDAGRIKFGYIEDIDNLELHDHKLVEDGISLDSNDGIRIKKISDFKYDVSFENKTVRFNMNDITTEPPKKEKLLKDEIYIGTSFDESGLSFYLLFNKAVNKLYWVLNEDIFQTESFTRFKQDIFIGDRTSFAFYIDKINNRKILIGAKGENVLKNNWYDGPFDQMPDNYIYNGTIEVQKYLELSYPYYKAQIDSYGHFISNIDTRIPVGNYHVYFSKEELNFVDSCKTKSKDENELCKCLTEEVFVVPPKYYNAYYTNYKQRSNSTQSKKNKI